MAPHRTNLLRRAGGTGGIGTVAPLPRGIQEANGREVRPGVVVRLKKFHAPLLVPVTEPLSEQTVGVIHAAADGRWPEAIIAAAARDASNDAGVVVVVGPRSARARQSLDDVTAPLGARLIGGSGFICGRRFPSVNGALWLVQGQDAELHTLPFAPGAIRRVYVYDAHMLKVDPLRTFPSASWVICGRLAPKTHWSRERMLKAAAVHRVQLDEQLAAYPQEPELRSEDPGYARLVLLDENADESGGDVDLVSFAASRLSVITDKPPAVLTPRQRELAQPQLRQIHKLLPLELNPLQLWYREEKRRLVQKNGGAPWYVLVKYRRGGFTTLEQAESYAMAVTRPHTLAVTMANTWEKSERIFKMVTDFHAHDPRAPRRLNDSKSSLELENGSNFFVGTAGSDAFSRGDGLSRFHGSEVAWWCDNNDEEVNKIWSSVAASAMYGEVVLESTPNGRNWFYRAYSEAKRGENGLHAVFVPWYRDPMNRALAGSFDAEAILTTLNEEERQLCDAHDLDAAQIAFRRAQKKIHRALFAQEFPEDDESCFLVSGHLFFDSESLLQSQRLVRGVPLREEASPGCVLRVHQDPIEGVSYGVGADPSEGAPGGDPCAAVIMRRDTRQVVAVLHGRLRPEVLAGHLKRLHERYNGALLGVERNNHGHAVIQKLEDHGIRRPHFRGGPMYYYHRGASLETSKPGWLEATDSRQLLLDHLEEWHREDPVNRVSDRGIIDEMGSFRLQKNGKYEADPGCHDDLIIACGIALQMCSVKWTKPSVTLLDGALVGSGTNGRLTAPFRVGRLQETTGAPAGASSEGSAANGHLIPPEGPIMNAGPIGNVLDRNHNGAQS